jgi:hypothetical protein
MTPAQFWDIEMQNQRSGMQMQQQANMAAQQQQQQMVGDIGSALGMFAGQYAENKALDAKGSAYADFIKRHGEQLGFDANYLEDFLKKKPREQAMIGDSILGMSNVGNRMMSLNYLNEQSRLFPRRTGTGTGPAPSGGGGESLTF